ncbi:MAG: L,D-transpeptidase family protein [Victivallaceae bacterium]|nr:L,D-transpeptidase family protein [Victivallaceae bacterium]NLK84143.1 L,D-transpeptidase family protein [Lentisphaerota bacterium]MDD3115893.1 L,D-transpeptidase family protein [Victivallaceae bacterium]MDD3704301.1 L,D-transpeptidase family protein [Victivallaceae bacterium]MDD4317016.1 L,D-transpeptidase family protein [Victivallaceae bacterium]
MSNIHYNFDTDSQQNSRMRPGLRYSLIIGLVLLGLVALFFVVYSFFPENEPENGKAVNIKEEQAKPEPSSLPKTAENTNFETLKPTVATETVAVPLSETKFDGRLISEIVNEAKSLNNVKEFGKARRLLNPVLESASVKQFSPEWLALAETLSVANTGIFFTDAPFPPHKVHYVVKRGDSLDKIANANNTTIEAVQKSNGLKENSSIIRVGAVMKIYKGDWRILVSRSRFLLILLDGKKIFKIYRIGVGRQDRTPNGTFVISAKVKEPSWYAPDGTVIPYGSAENLLGTRWLALRSSGETSPDFKGLGIHGTWEPETVGTDKSNGCIRMRNEDVEDLYSIIPRLTPVEITD